MIGVSPAVAGCRSGCRPVAVAITRAGSSAASPGPQPPSRPVPSPRSPIAVPTSWPLFRGDAQATGVARGELPEKLELLWTFSTANGGFESTAAIVDGSVYIGCTDGKLYALESADGAKRWEFSTPLGFIASAAVRGGRVYIGDSRRPVLLPGGRHAAGSCGASRPTPRSIPAPTSTAVTCCSALRTVTSTAWRPPRASSSGSIRARTRFAASPPWWTTWASWPAATAICTSIDLRQGKGVRRGEDRLAHGLLAGRDGRHRVRRHRRAHASSPSTRGGPRSSGVTRTPSTARRSAPRPR